MIREKYSDYEVLQYNFVVIIGSRKTEEWIISKDIMKVRRNKTNLKWDGYGKLVRAEVNLRFCGLATLRTNCCLTFCFQAELRRTIMTSTPFFRLVKLEWLAGELRVCQTSGNKSQHSDGGNGVVTHIYLCCLVSRTFTPTPLFPPLFKLPLYP